MCHEIKKNLNAKCNRTNAIFTMSRNIPKKGNRPPIAMMLVREIEMASRVRIKSKKQLDNIMFWASKICEKVSLVHQKCMKLAVKESNQ